MEEERCPNCDVEFVVSKFSDLEDMYGGCFDVWITYCPKCRYISDIDAD